MEALIVIVFLMLWFLFIATPCCIASMRGHQSTLAISACAIMGGVLTPFLGLLFLLWFAAFVWSLTKPR